MLNKRVLIISGSLISGAIIYFLSGSNAYITFGLNGGVHVIRNQFVINYIPDFLWAVAFVLSLSLFMDDVIVAGFLVILFGTIFELFQRYNIIKGTFDVFDVVIEGIGVILIVLFLRGTKNEK